MAIIFDLFNLLIYFIYLFSFMAIIFYGDHFIYPFISNIYSIYGDHFPSQNIQKPSEVQENGERNNGYVGLETPNDAIDSPVTYPRETLKSVWHLNPPTISNDGQRIFLLP